MLTKTPFFPAARPINAAKRGYSTDSTTLGFNGVLTDRAGGSAQTDLSNLVGLGGALCIRWLPYCQPPGLSSEMPAIGPLRSHEFMSSSVTSSLQVVW